MTSIPLRVLEILSDQPRTMGQQHGETYRDEIHEIAEIRLERICAMPPYRTVKDVLELAEQHVPILEQFDRDLYEEFCGIAESSNLSLERLVVLNHYTDLRDVVTPRAPQGERSGKEDNGGCSIIYSPHGPILGQTWDIHGSAEPYVLLLKLNDVMMLSITGCLGMTGINRHGVALAINNLVSIDAQLGILWPALIRKALTHKTAVDAKDEIMTAPIGSGRHFAIADANKFFSIEASGTKKKIISERADELFFHTNHCLDEEMRKTHIILKDSTTLARYRELDEIVRYQDLSTAANVFLAFTHVSLPPDIRDPHKITTCATFVIDVMRRSALACRGIANEELLSWSSTTHTFR